MKKSILVLVILGILGISVTQANDCIPPKPATLILDKVNALNEQQYYEIDRKLVDFSKATSTQIALVIVDDLCGMDKAMYATEIGQTWGVGQKGKDNGIVVLIKPTGGKGERVVFIAVGYGLEGVVPDAIAKRIVEIEMIPKFKNNDLYGGINAGIDVLIKLTKGEFTADEYKKQTEGNSWLIALLFFGILIIIFVSKFSVAKKYSETNHVSLITALFLLSSMSNHSGSYSNFSRGGGSFGSSSGGGFSGFGGGSFGGGGAGGSW